MQVHQAQLMKHFTLAQKHPSFSLCGSRQMLLYPSNLVLKIGNGSLKPLNLKSDLGLIHYGVQIIFSTRLFDFN
jgi:hypothetical protein